MSQVQSTTGPALQQEGPFKTFLRATEIDTRMLGMIGALLLIWVGFHLYGAYANGVGNFLTARNLWNLSVQTAAITVMATGMVLIIVTPHIDLSVGAMLGVTAMMMAVLQVWVLPKFLGIGHPAIWIITVIFGLIVGSIIGTFQGYLIAYLEIPSFIVTLGGSWSGAARPGWWRAAKPSPPSTRTFSLIGGGPYGSIGTTASWVVAVIACVGVRLDAGQRPQAARPLRLPHASDLAEFFIGGVSMLVILVATYVMNSYPWPKGIIKQYAAAHNLDPATLVVGHGWAFRC